MPEENGNEQKKKRFIDRLRSRKQKEPGMKGFERILVGVDFSLASRRAILLAQSLLGPDGFLYAIHVTPDIVDHTEMYLKEPGVKNLQQRVMHEAMSKLIEWAKKNKKAPCKLECVVAAGDPAAEIIKAAKSKGVQLIVLGVHGQKRSDLEIMGSTVDKVIRVSDCPVISVPTERI